MENFNLIVEAINKATKNGVFDLNEVQAIVKALQGIQEQLNGDKGDT